VHSLNHYTPREDRAGIFCSGSIDEFAISCTDLGDIHTLRIWHDNDGEDLQSARWKLDKVVVTCIQVGATRTAPTAYAGRILMSATQSTETRLGKGDFAVDTKKTSDSDQWHFVPEEHWLGCGE
jgi:hypothetical protein